jgi:hypothetical protein
MVFGHEYLIWKETDFPEHDWTDFYQYCQEDISKNINF